MIEFHDVRFEYPALRRPALDGVSLTLEPGQMVALLGSNGSGKSTVARLCNALLLPSGGRVLVDGMDTRDESSLWSVRSRVGMIQQNPDNQIVGTVAEEDVAFGPENLGVPREEIRRRVDEVLALVGLDGMQRREPHLLSEGQKQRLAIAGALAMRPVYLVADEPTAMLDPAGRTDVLEALRALRSSGVGMLYVTHRLSEVADADRVLVLREGVVAFDGTVESLLSDPDRADDLGVESPPEALLVRALRERGAPVPAGVRRPDEIVSALWPS